MMMTIHNDIIRSTSVAAVLTDALTPAMEYKRIITPSIDPRPPGKAGMTPINDETKNTDAIFVRVDERNGELKISYWN
jgi:hypothetical protein